MVICIGFLLLCGIRRGIINSSKENIIILVARIMIVVVRWNYTKIFLSNLGRGVKRYTIISIIISLIVVVGRTGFDITGLLRVFQIIVIVIILNLSSSYVINK